MEARALEPTESGKLRIRVEGKSVRPGKVAVRDLTRLAGLIQDGIEGVARVLSGERGVAPGPLPAPVRVATELLLTGIEAGSATLVLELPPPETTDEGAERDRLFEPTPTDLGFRALDHWVEGLHDLESGRTEVPQRWDNSVMEVAERLALVATERQVVIELNSRAMRHTRRARVTPELAPQFALRHAPTRRRRTARGELIAIDLRSGRVDVEDVAGRRVLCRFDPEASDLMGRVKQLLGQVVLVSGEEEFDAALNKAGKLEIQTIEGTAEAVPLGEMFGLNKTAEEQAREQEVTPIASVTELASSEQIPDEEFDAFVRAIREARRSE
ncbi:MAG: hypothetical protein L0206_04470 [Actinobacteria bacterium]|nr:hypothetical protein [Actinomycetota bacterium]